MLADLKILTTCELLELRDFCEEDMMELTVPWDVVSRLDALGKHILQAHSLYNPDPFRPVIRARTLFKLYDQGVENTVPAVMDVRRERWEMMPDFEFDGAA